MYVFTKGRNHGKPKVRKHSVYRTAEFLLRMELWICFSHTSYCNVIVRPNITEISRNLALNESNDVTLSCNATGKPSPDFMWSRPGNKDKKYPGSVLPLKNISREQDGEYWCTATNRLGNATASVRVTVNCKYEIDEAKAVLTVNCSPKQRKPETNTEVSDRLHELSFQ